MTPFERWIRQHFGQDFLWEFGVFVITPLLVLFAVVQMLSMPPFTT